MKLLKFVALVLVSVLFTFSNSAKAAEVSFSNVWVGKITPGTGHVGVDIWWPNSSGLYNPCHGATDIYYGACVMSNSGKNSYYKVMSYSPTGTNFANGIFIDNQNPNYCKTASWCKSPTANTINHGWGRLVAGAAIEIYPYDSSGKYNPYNTNVGGLRANVSSFPTLANGGRYSQNIGNISLPQIGQANVGKLNGFITMNGVPVNASRVNFDIFQNGSSLKSSTGYPLNGFSSVPNTANGYYSSGAVPSGSYKIYITDTITGRKVMLDGVSIKLPYERLDFKLEQRCFGYPQLNCVDPAK